MSQSFFLESRYEPTARLPIWVVISLSAKRRGRAGADLSTSAQHSLELPLAFASLQSTRLCNATPDPFCTAEASFGDLIILPRRDGAGTHVPPNTMVQVGAIEGH